MSTSSSPSLTPGTAGQLASVFPATSAVAFGTVAARGKSLGVHIGLRSDSKVGSGTEEDPFDGSNQVTLDSLLNALPANSRIILDAPGAAFTTKGNLAFTAKSGWTFILTPNTTFRLAVLSHAEAITNDPTAKTVAMFAGTNGTFISDVVVEGGIWDLNMQNQTETLCPSAISLVVDGAKIGGGGMKAINWGVTTTAEEFVFGVGSAGSRDSHIHRKKILWKDIELTSPAAVTNTGTITLINACGATNVASNSTLSNGWFENVEVTGINAHDIAIADSPAVDVINIGGWVKNFHGHHNRFTNITSGVARYGYYWDTGSVLNCRLESDEFSNVSGRNIKFAPSSSSYIMSNLSIDENMMTADAIAGTEFPIDIVATGGNITNVEITHNRIFPRGNFGQCIGAQNIAGLRVLYNTLGPSGTIVTTGSTNVQQSMNTQTDGTPTVGDLEYIQALSGHGAVAATNLTSLVTTYSNDGTSNTTSTLAAGTNGQIKTLTCIAVSGFSAVITVTNLLGGTTVTLSAAGKTVTLQYLNSKWTPISNIGATIA